MEKNSGVMFELPDGRKSIVYDKQPLLAEKGLVTMNLLNDDLSIKINEQGKPATIFKASHIYNELAQTWKLIGYVD